MFHGKGRCAECHQPPFFLDDKMHDLHLERFYEPEMIAGQRNIQDGPIKTFTLRGIKDSPPYHHDGRLLTLDDTVEFFNLVLELKLTQEKRQASWRSCERYDSLTETWGGMLSGSAHEHALRGYQQAYDACAGYEEKYKL